MSLSGVHGMMHVLPASVDHQAVDRCFYLNDLCVHSSWCVRHIFITSWNLTNCSLLQVKYLQFCPPLTINNKSYTKHKVNLAWICLLACLIWLSHAILRNETHLCVGKTHKWGMCSCMQNSNLLFRNKDLTQNIYQLTKNNIYNTLSKL